MKKVLLGLFVLSTLALASREFYPNSGTETGLTISKPGRFSRGK